MRTTWLILCELHFAESFEGTKHNLQLSGNSGNYPPKTLNKCFKLPSKKSEAVISAEADGDKRETKNDESHLSEKEKKYK